MRSPMLFVETIWNLGTDYYCYLFLSIISFTFLLFFSHIYMSYLDWILPFIYFTDPGELSGTTASPHSGAFYFNSSVCQLSNCLGRLDALFSVSAERIHAPLGDEDRSPLLMTEAGGGVILGTQDGRWCRLHRLPLVTHVWHRLVTCFCPARFSP